MVFRISRTKSIRFSMARLESLLPLFPSRGIVCGGSNWATIRHVRLANEGESIRSVDRDMDVPYSMPTSRSGMTVIYNIHGS